MPTWTPRPTFEELGIVGWFKARLGEIPLRPDRSASLRSEGGGRLDRLDLFLVVMLVIGTLLLRTFRLAEPYQMHFDEVYHARTATEFLQYWRYGLVPRRLRVDAPAPREVRDGRRSRAVGRGPRQRDERPRGAGPGRRRRAAPGRRARRPTSTQASASTSRPGPRSGPTTCAPASSSRPSPPRARARWPSTPTGNQLVIGYDDGRIATLDLTAIAIGGVGVGPPTIEPLATVDHPVDHLLVTDDGGFVVAASADRLSTVDLNGGTVAGSVDLAAIADLAPGGSGPALMARVDDVADPSAAASTIAGILSTDAADYASRLAAASPGTTVVLGDPGTGDARTKLDTAISNGTLPGITHRQRVAHRGRDGRRRRVRRPGARLGRVDDPARRGRPRPRHGDRPGQPEAVRDGRRRREADLRGHRGRRGRGQERPRGPGSEPATRAGHPDRLRRGQPAGPHPRPRAWRDRGRAVDRLRRRAARQRRVRRCPAAGRLRAGGLGGRLQPDVPVGGSPAAAPVRWRRGIRDDRCRIARLRLAAARGHRRGADGGAHLPPRPDPLPPAPDRRAGRPVRHRRRDVLRPVADRDERRLRGAVHRRRLHAVRRAVDRLVARSRGLLGGACRSSACCSGSRSPASGWRPTPSGRCCS